MSINTADASLTSGNASRQPLQTARSGATGHDCENVESRGVKRLNPKAVPEGQGELFSIWRHHAFLTDDTLVIEQAEPRHRHHAVVEQVFSDLENGPLAHLPSGRFNANAAWLVLAAAAFNLMRAAGRIASPFHAKATGATLRRTLVNVPARIATSARRIRLHLPEHWPWAWEFERAS
ncbi:transposase [Catenulispora sp. NF23]|uniref:transposase n=1 Tax=Catenulispora pinistramenti TaxID=2705254 RepID=UPI001BA7B1E4|nr:transposase [Catenulispora pinistramenti]